MLTQIEIMLCFFKGGNRMEDFFFAPFDWIYGWLTGK